MLINKREKEKEEKNREKSEEINSVEGVSLVDLKTGSKSFFLNKIVSEYVPTKLAAELLGISENALRIKVCRGQVPVHKFGRSLRFRIAEIGGLLTKKE